MCCLEDQDVLQHAYYRSICVRKCIYADLNICINVYVIANHAGSGLKKILFIVNHS